MKPFTEEGMGYEQATLDLIDQSQDEADADYEDHPIDNPGEHDWLEGLWGNCRGAEEKP